MVRRPGEEDRRQTPDVERVEADLGVARGEETGGGRGRDARCGGRAAFTVSKEPPGEQLKQGTDR